MERRLPAVLLTLAMLPAAMPAQTPKDPPAGVVAQVDGERISSQALNEAAGESLAKAELQVYQLKQKKLQNLIDDHLLAKEAKRRNVTLDALVASEVTAKAVPVTNDDIHRIYELNKAQLQRPEAEVTDQIRSLLQDQKIADRRREFAKSLEANSKVEIYLDPPPPFRMTVGIEGPTSGAANAAVTIVEFEDFQCPFCRKAQETVQQVLAQYKDKVRLVHRDFPLQPLHPDSEKAHEAARCALEHGKFWEYRELLYKNAPAAGPLLMSYATQLGMDSDDFKKCVDSGKYKDAVLRDEGEGEKLGVQGTPAFFINGRPLSGAQPESEFARIIDEELKLQAAR
jgi:protein-disulfide isomerase